MRRFPMLPVLLLAACATSGGGKVGRPRVDRCAMQGARAACEMARAQATTYARRLAVDDQVCIDGKQRLEQAMEGCELRGFVESTAPNGVMVEIREAPSDSRYPRGTEWWFSEEALADLQLRALGYRLDSDEGR
jgi:hypothetical protein